MQRGGGVLQRRLRCMWGGALGPPLTARSQAEGGEQLRLPLVLPAGGTAGLPCEHTTGPVPVGVTCVVQGCGQTR